MSVSGINSFNSYVPAASQPKKKEETADPLMSVVPSEKDDPVAEFRKYMKMTPAERMQYLWLMQHGITKEEYEKMSAEDKQKIIAEMKRDIEQQIKQDALKPSKKTNIIA